MGTAVSLCKIMMKTVALCTLLACVAARSVEMPKFASKVALLDLASDCQLKDGAKMPEPKEPTDAEKKEAEKKAKECQALAETAAKDVAAKKTNCDSFYTSDAKSFNCKCESIKKLVADCIIAPLCKADYSNFKDPAKCKAAVLEHMKVGKDCGACPADPAIIIIIVVVLAVALYCFCFKKKSGEDTAKNEVNA